MNIDIILIDGKSIAMVNHNSILIHQAQDALDLMADCQYMGADSIIMNKKIIDPQFFDLRTGVAGEVLQKFSTYRMRLAIVGDFSEHTSKSLRDFIYESNKTGHIYFVGSIEEAKKALSK